jgi:drug/metabolite transporter (DMT)-like permease
MTEHFHVDWVGEFAFALGWLVLVLSLGAVSLLNWLIRHSDAVNVASLFYLVPPCTALVAWLLFGDTFSGLALCGMAIAVWGVYLARK